MNTINKDSRIINLEGAPNFRDVGGIAATNGFKIKSGMLFRSDELSKLTPGDIDSIEKLNIKLICDIRTMNERTHRPDKVINHSIRNINIPIQPQNEEINKFKFFFFMAFKANEFDFKDYLNNQYHIFAFERTKQIKELFDLISNPINYPAVIHCTAGKDRTGLITALIQLYCGASREDVIKDYMITNSLNGHRKKNMIDYLRFMSLYRIPAERIKPLLDAREEYLNNVLDEIFDKFNSIEEYLINHCGIEKTKLDQLRLILIEEQNHSGL